MQHLFRLIIFIFLCIYISFPHAFATEKNKEFYPGCTSQNQGDFCEDKYYESWWKHHWPSISRQMNELAELIRQSNLKGDYTKLKDYIMLPVKFCSDKERVEKQYKEYNVVARNFEEFQNNLRFVADSQMKDEPDRRKQDYIKSGDSDLVGYHHRIWLSIVCLDSSDTSIINQPITGWEKDKCANVKVMIDAVALW